MDPRYIHFHSHSELGSENYEIYLEIKKILINVNKYFSNLGIKADAWSIILNEDSVSLGNLGE
jgi:hypothetical protein